MNALNHRTKEWMPRNNELMNHNNQRMNALNQGTNKSKPINNELMNYCNLRMNMRWTKKPMNESQETKN